MRKRRKCAIWGKGESVDDHCSGATWAIKLWGKGESVEGKQKYEEKDDHCAGASSAGKLESAFALCAQPLLLSPRVKLHQFFLS